MLHLCRQTTSPVSHSSSMNSTEVSRKMCGWAEKHRYRGGNSSVCNHCQKLIPSQNLKLSVKSFTLLEMKMIRFRSIIYKREITPLIEQSAWGTKEINNQWNLNWNADFEIVWKTDWQHSCSNDIKFCKLMYPCRVHHMVKWSEADAVCWRCVCHSAVGCLPHFPGIKCNTMPPVCTQTMKPWHMKPTMSRKCMIYILVYVILLWNRYTLSHL